MQASDNSRKSGPDLKRSPLQATGFPLIAGFVLPPVRRLNFLI